MAFSFAQAGGGGAAEVTAGPDLELIQTEGLGFLSVAGETKLQFVSKWTEPPLPTASLVSIASHKGLIAAAGPDAVHVAQTDAVRNALTAEGDGDSDIRPFSAPIRIAMPFRVGHLAFTADETYLVLSAETGGGLAVYDVQALVAQGGSVQPAFELSTNGEPLRSLVPNPMADKAELVALVTANGNLLMADLVQRALRTNANGQPVLRAQVSCATWSSRGKQLVAGGADGSVYQMTPDGQDKGHVPKPPQITGDFYVASLAWLENDVFLVVHNPAALGSPSVYHIVTRNTKTGGAPAFVYQKLNDPVEPFGDKAPHHTILRLRDFPPNLQDLLLIASTAVENIGLLTRSKTPLTSGAPADKITHVFTTTELADDARRAQLPMSADYNDTFPIGVALDLSGRDKVPKPIPADEIDESPGPLPGLCVVNNEGVLISWWIVYNESIRQGTTFPGLVAVEGGASAGATNITVPAAADDNSMKVAPATSGFSASAFGNSSPAPAPTASSNSAVAAAPAFGKPAFGAPSFGAPAFGAPAFGSPSAPAAPRASPAFGSSGFGAAGALGNRASPWASGGKAAAAPAFGQSAFGSPSPSSGTTPAAGSSSGGGFSAFANKPSPFGSVAPSSDKPNPFGSLAASDKPSPFGSLATSSDKPSPFGSLAASDKPSPFGSLVTSDKPSPFGSTTTSDKPNPFGSTTNNGASPFGAFASNNNGQSTFGSLAAGKPNSGSIFGSVSSGSKPFGSSSSTSVFGQASGADASKDGGSKPSNPFGSSPFVLGTTFKADTASAQDNETTPQKGGSLFGSGFGLSLDDAAKQEAAKDKDMDTTPEPSAKPTTSNAADAAAAESTTPTTTPGPAGSRYFDPLKSGGADSASSKTGGGMTSAPSLFSSKPSGSTTSTGLFGKPLEDGSPTPANPFAAKPGGLFGSTKPAGETGGLFGSKQKPAGGLLGSKSADEAPPKEAEVPAEAKDEDKKVTALPLPPDTISKAAYLFEDSSASSRSSSAHTFASHRSNQVAEKEDAENVKAEDDDKKKKSTPPAAEPPLPPWPEETKQPAREATPPPPPLPEDTKDKEAAEEDVKPAVTNPFGASSKPGGFSFTDSKPAFDFKDGKAKPFDFKDTKPKPFDFKDAKPKSYYPLFSSTPKKSDDPAMKNPFANLGKSVPTEESEESEEEESEDSAGDAEEGEEEGEVEGEEGEFDSEEEEAEEEEGHEGDDDDEGSGTDVGKDLTQSTGLMQTPSFARGESSFATLGGVTDTSGSFTQVDASRTSLFGQPQPSLQAPRAPQATSPRSPSPQRRPLAKVSGGPAAVAGRTLLRDDGQRSFSAPSMASQLLGAATSRQGRPGGANTNGGGLFARRVPRDVNVEEQRKADAARAAAEAEAEQAAAAPEDSYDVLDRELDQPLAPTRQLAECLYLLDSDIAGGDTVPSQVEAVYRDINRMVLVLKVNSRNIDAFLRGHSRAGAGQDRQDRKAEDDLETPDDWVLCDVDDLGAIVSRDLPSKLRGARVQGEEALAAEATALLREGSRLQVLHADMVRVLQAHGAGSDGEGGGAAAAAARSLPLSAEQATQQSEVRRAFAAFVARLAEAEQQVVLLRAKMASLAAAKAAAGGGGHDGEEGTNGAGAGAGAGAGVGKATPVPTVDAVLRTIARMTAMAEKRSGDIDVLEAQVRKLNLGASLRGSVQVPSSSSSGRSREGSPFSTPKKQHQKRASLVFAPGSSAQKRGSGLFSASAAAAAAASPGTFSSPAGGTPTRRKLSGYTDEEKAALRAKKAGRQRTLARLQKMQQAEGPRYMAME